MNRLHKIVLIVFIGLGCWTFPASAADKQVVVDSLSTDSTMLKVDFHAEAMIDNAIREQLRSGFTAIFEYQVQLWSRRTLIFSKLITQEKYRVKLAYDNWDRRYHIQTDTEDRKTSSLQKVKEICLDVRKFDLIPIKKLKLKTKYSVTVLLLLKPISVENLKEIERALKGEQAITEKSAPEPDPGKKEPVTSRFLKFIVAFTGLGDKVISSNKVNFYLNEQEQVIWVD